MRLKLSLLALALVVIALTTQAKPCAQSNIGGCGFCVNYSSTDYYADHYNMHNGCMEGSQCYWGWVVYYNGSSFYTQGGCHIYYDASGNIVSRSGC